MSIKTKNGYSRSSRSVEEDEKLLQQTVDNMSEEEVEALRLIVEGIANPKQAAGRKLLSQISGMEYKRTPVDLRTFVHDEYYLGNTCDALYPRLMDDLEELFEGGYNEAILTGAIGWGKCVSSWTLIYDDSTGKRLAVKELVGRTPLVPSLSEDGALIHTEAARVWHSGQKECLKARLASGQHLEASWDHPVLTPDGYRPLGDLKPKDLVACARTLPEPKHSSPFTDNEVLLTAALMADGCMTSGNTIYSKGNADLVETVENAACEVIGKDSPGDRRHERGCWHVNFRGAQSWTVDRDIRVLSKDKRVPADMFGLPNRQTAILIRWLWTDGSVYTKKPRKIEITLASEGMVDDLQYLLRRFGVNARKAYAPKKNQSGKTFDAWRLQIGDAPNIVRFLEDVGFIPGKESECSKLLDTSRDALETSNTNYDIAPVGYEELKVIRKETGPHNKRWWAKNGLVSKGFLGRAKFLRLCDAVGYRGKYWKLASSDVVWEQVEHIEPAGVQDVYDLTVPETANVEANGVIVHNTFTASIGVCRVLYELSCMRDPQRSFGIATNSNISLVCLSVNEDLAMKVAYENIAGKIEASPYFQEHFPFQKTKKELRFPNKIIVAARATTDNSVLGLNVIGGLLDESNFMRKRKSTDPRFNLEDHARVLYNAMMRRMKSRFGRRGKLPGTLFVVSSKQTHDDFTAKRIKEAQDDPGVFVRDYSLWDVKPEIYYSDDWFHVVVGNEQSPSRILSIDEDPVDVERSLPEGCIIIKVPEDHRHDFESDLEGAIRDLAGCATVSISPFIQRREKIIEAIDPSRTHPYTVETFDPSIGGSFKWAQMVKQSSEIDLGMDALTASYRPIVNPYAPRHVHIDPSLTGDATGIAMGHVSGFKMVQRRDDEGFMHTERAPIIYIDFMLRIVPPVGDEIVLGDLRRFVYQLNRHGYMITMVTMDSWQSAEAIQKLNAKGFNAEQLSVDKALDPYTSLKSALYENRLNIYEYPTLLRELRELEHDRIKKKIDHPNRGCFVGSTRIPLLDGTFPEIASLDGKEVWVYSARSDGMIVPGRARGRMSKRTRHLVDVVLDNGAVERCTPDHLWMLRDGSYKEAQHLRPGVDRLMPICRQWPVNGGYERVSDLHGRLTLTHHMVWSALNGCSIPEGCCVHHTDHVKTNNHPDNLVAQLLSEHARQHTSLRHSQDGEYAQAVRNGLQRFNESAHGRAVHAAAIRRTLADMTPEALAKRARNRPSFRSDVSLDRLVEALRAGSGNANTAAQFLDCGRNVVVRVLRDHDFESWDSFASGRNHKVRAVIPVVLSKPIPVFDLEVDRWSNFALCSGVFVHNSKDVADAVAGVTYTLSEKAQHLPMGFLQGQSLPGDAWMVEHQQRALAESYGAVDEEQFGPRPDRPMDVHGSLPPFLVGNTFGSEDDGGWMNF